MSHQAAVVETVCGNCGAELGGAYCQACGQKAIGPDVSLHDFFHEAFHEFAHVDGKIVQTLRLLLTKPGLLTKEFLSGRRARYISPLRVYLLCSLLFFALAALAPEAAQPFFRVTKADGEAGLDPAAVQRLRDAASRQASIAIVHDFRRAMFALMPAFSLLTWVLYRKARRFYAAHLYYSIHFHAFMFVVLTVSLVIALVGGRYGRAFAGLGSVVDPCLSLHKPAACVRRLAPADSLERYAALACLSGHGARDNGVARAALFEDIRNADAR